MVKLDPLSIRDRASNPDLRRHQIAFLSFMEYPITVSHLIESNPAAMKHFLTTAIAFSISILLFAQGVVSNQADENGFYASFGASGNSGLRTTSHFRTS